MQTLNESKEERIPLGIAPSGSHLLLKLLPWLVLMP